MKKIFAKLGRNASARSKIESKSYAPQTAQAYYYQVGKPVWSGRNYQKFADEAYSKMRLR